MWLRSQLQGRHDPQNKDSQHKNTQQNDLQHSNKSNATLSIMQFSIMAEYCYAEYHLCSITYAVSHMLSVPYKPFMLSVVMLNVVAPLSELGNKA